jgi:hypothetical protein
MLLPVGHWLDHAGPSILHGSCARGYAQQHGGNSAASLQAAPLLPQTAMKTCDDATALDASIFTECEPVLAHKATAGWPAASRWSSPASLRQHYGALRFDVASGQLQMSLAEYLDYASSTAADFPYYIVETHFKGALGRLLQDYEPLPLFAHDLQPVPGTSSRPHWFLGGARTGSALHVDPRSSFGWNTCLFGCKRWCMLAPSTDLSRHGLDPPPASEGGPCGWFLAQLERLQAASAAGELTMRECVQRPGDVVYVPFGWHHCVLNCETSLAIAHTLVNSASLPPIWPRMRAQYPAFAVALREMLEHQNQIVLSGQRKPPYTELAAKLPAAAPTREQLERAVLATPPSSSADADKEPVRLRLSWQTLASSPSSSSSSSSSSILFVHVKWLDQRLQARPPLAQLVGGGGDRTRAENLIEGLWNYHEQLNALSCELLCRDASTLCLVLPAAAMDGQIDAHKQGKRNHDAKDGAETSLSRYRAALALHGLHVHGVVPEGGELAWAAQASSSSNATEMAILHADGSDPDERQRAAAVGWAVEKLPLSGCLVRAQSCGRTCHAGVGLSGPFEMTTTSRCKPGSVLMRVPLRQCLTSNDLSAGVAKRLPAPSFGSGEDESELRESGHARLMVALLELMIAEVLSPERQAVKSYLQGVCSERVLAAAGGHLLLWPVSSLAAERAGNSVAWERACRARASVAARRAELIRWGAPDLDLQRYLWAATVVQTRALALPGASCFALCPGIELPRHLTTGATAEIQLSCPDDDDHDRADGPTVQLVSRFSLQAGSVVSRCYEVDDPVCEYLDVFERYGFWATDATVHTAEVRVSSVDLYGDGGGAGGATVASGWRQDLIAEAALFGCDADFASWWVPDEAVDACPLVVAVRATLVEQGELTDADTASSTTVAALRRPIRREREVRAKLAQLFRAHLGGYATSIAQDAVDLRGAGRGGGRPLSADEETAARLVQFEKRLLLTHVRAFESEAE